MLFKYAIEHLPDDNQKRIHNFYLDFQKQYGTRQDMEDMVLHKRKNHLEDKI